MSNERVSIAEFESAPGVKQGIDNYDTLMRVAEFVKNVRTSSQLSQTTMFERSGIAQADISRIETGSMERGPSILTLVRLAHATGKVLVLGLAEKKGEHRISHVLEL